MFTIVCHYWNTFSLDLDCIAWYWRTSNSYKSTYKCTYVCTYKCTYACTYVCTYTCTCISSFFTFTAFVTRSSITIVSGVTLSEAYYILISFSYGSPYILYVLYALFMSAKHRNSSKRILKAR